ncbi:RdgB/HAM1 family non-canonical purine NTP pyrophosphatase [Suttonella sp. R2A3]|uniref:RdgB/HAM1 family non-canonical purine NTP pyrophosphatase n=1 Tax=Suttonella sp. R2A3 TaxID=2908648 RepID=UPI001F34D0CB|nr:RdgB/HAM1 family non-canonical purine NTP pyrophosphatase [Suttonella sp. R2A3]UJF25342.1 RdgB/HAM1 family non-canonical purine NTP pyrophosphatase [Suttonella sp. R2A3]
MKNCVLASNNRKKIAELRAILESLNIRVHPQSEWDITDAEETGTTFIENAIIKARHAARISGLAAIADDSGICVPALAGAPGVYSARYAGEPSDDGANNAKLLRELSNQSDRSAYYVCAIVYLRHADDPLPLIAQGLWHGEVLKKACGEGGFGYDPLFYLPDLGCSAAELASDDKNRISHRAQALEQLATLLANEHS